MKFTSTIAILGLSASALARGHTKRSGSNGKIIYECTKPGVVAVTFDDGPSNLTDQLLDILAKAGAKVTFFLTGVNIEPHRAVVARAHREGHQLAQHTWSHKHMSELSPQERADEMLRPEAAFAKILGLFPTYMRPPYGECNADCEDQLGDLGYHVINWNIDTNDLDWRGNMDMSKRIVDTRLTKDVSGPIVLAHDMKHTIEILAAHIISTAKAHGLKMVTSLPAEIFGYIIRHLDLPDVASLRSIRRWMQRILVLLIFRSVTIRELRLVIKYHSFDDWRCQYMEKDTALPDAETCYAVVLPSGGIPSSLKGLLGDNNLLLNLGSVVVEFPGSVGAMESIAATKLGRTLLGPGPTSAQSKRPSPTPSLIARSRLATRRGGRFRASLYCCRARVGKIMSSGTPRLFVRCQISWHYDESVDFVGRLCGLRRVIWMEN
ncbi:hypothetical protein MCOR07_001793 [Pyricularia oryzae]|nr:hypothetical protein MCOR15_002087 [Pyricularia oryzae]KAI6500836.1 hypothetical protein MCOR11_002545 [Pyricularia oryzae]KAI6574135.1 hypothetical protein MCOR09_002431 [Pyricularia oryzae]KAI6627693.1 hypothetical protein MCOR07_001793 [Pyricularia oryzae]